MKDGTGRDGFDLHLRTSRLDPRMGRDRGRGMCHLVGPVIYFEGPRRDGTLRL